MKCFATLTISIGLLHSNITYMYVLFLIFMIINRLFLNQNHDTNDYLDITIKRIWVAIKALNVPFCL